VKNTKSKIPAKSKSSVSIVFCPDTVALLVTRTDIQETVETQVTI